MKKMVAGLVITAFFPSAAMANYRGMMEGQYMMWGGHGWVLLIHGFYMLFYLVILILFFWLLFRMTKALEVIAKSKKKEE